MGFSLGIVGLPNVGKSTLFNALSSAGADVSNYPFCTIKPNIGMVQVPDERLKTIQKVAGSVKSLPTVIEFTDIAGLVKGAHKGEGLGNQFLSHIREVDAIAHIVRCFSDEGIAHVEGKVDPRRDIELINAELILSDLATIDKQFAAVKTALKTGDKKILKFLNLLEKVKETLDKGEPASALLSNLSHEDRSLFKDLHLLTLKPILYVANVDESGNPEQVKVIEGIAKDEHARLVTVCAKLEMEMKELSLEDAREFLKASGRSQPALNDLIKTGYELLELITFFTANQKECRAWTVRSGASAPAAAGKVHSDMERGFIAAEVINFEDLAAAGSYAAAREKGLLRTEGKEYQVRDGDVMLVRFNV